MHKFRQKHILFVFLFTVAALLFAQQGNDTASSELPGDQAEASSVEEYENENFLVEDPPIEQVVADRVLPIGFLELQLGSGKDFINQALIESDYFLYNGEPEISFRSPDQEYVFDAAGRAFIDRALFQFENELLKGIDIYFNKSKIDYYSLHTTFTTKYGDPDLVHPRFMVWENARVLIRISKEIRIQYIQKSDVVLPQEKQTSTVERFLDLF